ncbi:hypothetical protein DOTSEDRAFT_178490 [Dothistroma septosporum NZE10]|uniref:Major facilitator superfamily (MFS) profile domain-containing protein n=1 Tax=Dothistroma septosporum (strain NZE10 / CBS 128990) TaxID=675120 RepID=N1PG65_DOTSN|nr:hypothetical protein DOTSEDRAFT_178490 [Dothistroma septosporum NZE10]
MAISQYAPIEDYNGRTTDESSTSTRRTVDSDSGDDVALNELEAEDGYELRTLDLTREDDDHKHTTAGAAEDDDQESEDDETPLAGGRRRRRRSSAQSFELYTPDEERAVKRKLDTRLVLFVALLYMMAFLDRSNIGNAKVAGLSRDLNLSDDQFSWILEAFYTSYVLFEWMTICYKIFPPHIYVSVCVFAWGVLASLQSIATSFPFMLVLRIMLGIGEAAFVGMPIYLSFFFRREELAFRIGIFIAAAPLATTFASTLAYGIVSLGNVAGITSWRLLFLFEGFPATIVAVWTWYWLPDSPATARWLNLRERRIATLRMRKETTISAKAGKSSLHQASVPRYKQKFQWTEVKNVLTDPVSYLTAGMFFCCNVAFSSMPVFLPTILNSMGYTKHAAQGLSAIPFFCAFLGVLITAIVSDRVRSRSIPMILHALLAVSGYTILAIAGFFEFGHTLRYLAVFPICVGFFSAVTIVITWTVNNQASDEAKGAGMAILNIIGQCGPFLGTRLYPDSDGPYFVKGMTVCAVAMALVAILAFVLRIVLVKKNRQWGWKGAQSAPGSHFVYMT